MFPDLKGYKHPVRNVSEELLSRLVLEDNHVRPLPGGVGRRPTLDPDPRLSKLNPGLVPTPEETCFYEHVATIRYRSPKDPKQDQFFVAFRQTMDALLLEQQDAQLYPEHVMKSDVKKTELKTYIYVVHKLPRQVPILRSHEDWLSPIADPSVFDTLAYFLLKNRIISEEMYGRMQ